MMEQWSAKRANEWFASIPLPFGCNFLPSTAVNSTEMWQADTFDPDTIERELQFAAGLGYNTVRVFLQFMVWEADPAGHNERLETFLRLADAAGITMMPILFDDCRFDDRDPYPGRQDDPKPGVHNSRWTPSPGYATADDPARWPQLEAYVNDVVGAFGSDRRVLVWDLYNEPGGDRPKESLPLVEAAFRWARAADPRQPLTVGSFFWHDYMTEIRLCGERNSDVVSFHSYGNLHEMRERLDELAKYGRPLLCTEWLARHHGSGFASHLPLFRERNVGVYQWGLVAGRTQTWLHWYTRYSPEPDGEPRLWLHDVMRPDGSLFDPAEAAVLRDHAGCDLAPEPVPMTCELMADLERRGLIIRLRPGGHDLAAQPGETLGESIYETADRYGPHKLIAVTVNRAEFAAFGTHPDNEEFLLIGNPDSQPMYLAVALCMREEFEDKVKTGRLTAADFVMIECRYNDPEASFFVMRAGVPHGEAIVPEAGKPPPSFYVTESRDLPLDTIDLRKYRLRVAR